MISAKYLAMAAIGLGLCASIPALAEDAAKPSIEVTAPWTRATVRGASVAVGYLTIENKGAVADRLVGATADAAGKVELHETQMKDGVMSMRALTSGLEIKPGAKVAFKPGSYHLMLLGLKAPLLPGGSVHAVLTFDKAGEIAVDMPVEAVGATSPAPASMENMHH